MTDKYNQFYYLFANHQLTWLYGTAKIKLFWNVDFNLLKETNANRLHFLPPTKNPIPFQITYEIGPSIQVLLRTRTDVSDYSLCIAKGMKAAI